MCGSDCIGNDNDVDDVVEVVCGGYARWCDTMRTAYKTIQKGMKSNRNLSRERIDRLEEIGFKWQSGTYDDIFEERCRELIVFKKEVGNCNVLQRYACNPSLGKWCSNLRSIVRCTDDVSDNKVTVVESDNMGDERDER